MLQDDLISVCQQVQGDIRTEGDCVGGAEGGAAAIGYS